MSGEPGKSNYYYQKWKFTVYCSTGISYGGPKGLRGDVGYAGFDGINGRSMKFYWSILSRLE